MKNLMSCLVFITMLFSATITSAQDYNFEGEWVFEKAEYAKKLPNGEFAVKQQISTKDEMKLLPFCYENIATGLFFFSKNGVYAETIALPSNEGKYNIIKVGDKTMLHILLNMENGEPFGLVYKIEKTGNTLKVTYESWCLEGTIDEEEGAIISILKLKQ